MAILGGLLFTAAAPLGFLLSIIGLLFDRNRKAALLGLLVSGTLVLGFVLNLVMMRCTP